MAQKNDTTRAVNQYLTRYAEPECLWLNEFPAHHCYKHCVIIPAYDEPSTFIARLTDETQLLERNQALAIVVINQPEDVESCEKNIELITFIQQQLPSCWTNHSLSLFGNSNWGILIVDRFTHKRIPKKQGVGLARKIGADIATTLIQRNNITTRWIHSTDADAHLPHSYFEALTKNKSSIVATYNYQHKKDSSAISDATAIYEKSLHYYVAGLRYAKSPYAFHTLGSILAFAFSGYCQVRGFPKRAGGEDFYLLNKIAKLGDVIELTETIELEPRASHRVPFGTGPAVEKISQLNQTNATYCDYDPVIFTHLKEFLEAANQQLDANVTLDFSNLPEPTQAALSELKVDDISQHLKDTNGAQKKRQFHQWFDAFRTLKFIHYLQRHYYPAIGPSVDYEKRFPTT